MSTYTEHDFFEDVAEQGYKYGFVTDVESTKAPKGLSESTVRYISAQKEEPEWLLETRLKAFRHFEKLLAEGKEPTWAHLNVPAFDYQDAYYYSAPGKKARYDSIDDVPPEVLADFARLGIPLGEQARLAGVAVDAVMDSVSVGTTFQAELAKLGILFMPFSEAVEKHPDLVRKYMGTVVPYTDNLYAALNSAVFSDGSFCYVPPGVRCPLELSTYFRINEAQTGQFERTLLIADEGSYVSYMEGCTAPMREEHQLHAAIVEIVAHRDAEVKYSTVQNWYPGNAEGVGGIFNFVTKRALCEGDRSKVTWTQLETGSAITWKYPSCILKGDHSVGEFYSVAFTKDFQQADTGTKMIHLGKNTRSTIISKGISAGQSSNAYRGLVKVNKKATGARNFSQCDSLLIGDQCGAHTFPYIEIHNDTAKVEHEATTSKVGEDQLFYCQARGISEQDALNLIVNGYAKEILARLPMEFAVEAQKLLSVQLEGSVG
ncbi:MAG TPA: Fe-S cluster assembly protein SufB [Rubricoccaceae bacterium]